MKGARTALPQYWHTDQRVVFAAFLLLLPDDDATALVFVVVVVTRRFFPRRLLARIQLGAYAASPSLSKKALTSSL
jgi:hypothetical protein